MISNKLHQFTRSTPFYVSLTQKTSACCHLTSPAGPTLHFYVTLAQVARSLQSLRRPSGRENGEDKGAGRNTKACSEMQILLLIFVCVHMCTHVTVYVLRIYTGASESGP